MKLSLLPQYPTYRVSPSALGTVVVTGATPGLQVRTPQTPTAPFLLPVPDSTGLYEEGKGSEDEQGGDGGVSNRTVRQLVFSFSCFLH